MIRPPDSKRRGPRGGSEGPSPLSSFARAPRGSKLVAAPLRSRLYFGMHDGSASPSLPLSLYLTPDRCLTLMLVKVRLGVAWTAVSSTSPAISGSLATDARTLNPQPLLCLSLSRTPHGCCAPQTSHRLENGETGQAVPPWPGLAAPFFPSLPSRSELEGTIGEAARPHDASKASRLTDIASTKNHRPP